MTSLKTIKTAIIHDSFTHIGGAEKVLLKLVKLFPQADIYIPIINRSLTKKIIKKNQLKTTFLINFIFLGKYISIFKPLILIYWELLNLSKYQLIISSSHSFSSKSVKTNKSQLHISYIHTTPRYLYNEFNELNFIKKFPAKYLFQPLKIILQKWDLKGAKRPDILIANSKETQSRIKKYYHLNSHIISPPVDTKNKKDSLIKNKKYYLFFSRLVKQKGAQLAVETFNDLENKKLIVIGDGPERKQLEKTAGKNIEFKGFINEKRLNKILQQTKALIYCSIEEDFGMIPIEVMAYGIPVIAYHSGGTKEYIIPNKTGIFFKSFTKQALKQAIKRFEKTKINKQNCIKQAQQFSGTIFIKKILKICKQELKKKQII